ncbi:MAG: acyl carrier protein, partial [Actinomycetota bacterium]|nr:acyl carrier protein [Actinomycetota bacterium]
RARPGRGEEGVESLRRRLSGVPEPKWPEIVLDLVCDRIADVLGLESRETVNPELTFKEMGFDSLDAVELRNGIMRSTRLHLPATVVFDHPTPVAVAEHMLAQLSGGGAARPQPEERVLAVDERVQSLLAGPGESADVAVEDLDAVSDEEMFALIDKKFGSS